MLLVYLSMFPALYWDGDAAGAAGPGVARCWTRVISTLQSLPADLLAGRAGRAVAAPPGALVLPTGAALLAPPVAHQGALVAGKGLLQAAARARELLRHDPARGVFARAVVAALLARVPAALELFTRRCARGGGIAAAERKGNFPAVAAGPALPWAGAARAGVTRALAAVRRARERGAARLGAPEVARGTRAAFLRPAAPALVGCLQLAGWTLAWGFSVCGLWCMVWV